MANPTASRLLLVKLSSLGDVVHALPLLQALRAGLAPDAVIAWAVSKPFAPLLENNPHLSWTHVLPSKGAADVWRFGQELRSHDYETAFDAQGLFVSGAVTALSGAARRVGFDNNREGNRVFLTDAVVPGGERIHVVQRLLGFLDTLDIPRPTQIEPQTYLTTTDVSALMEPFAGGDAPLIGCVIGASVANKSWTLPQWVRCLVILRQAGCRIILVGSADEAEAADALRSDNVLNLAGRTSLPELASVLAKCAVVIGPDSGATHLAVAVGTPVVGLYGVTDPAKTGVLWGSRPAVVLDYAETDAPPALRRARHPTLPDALARIPAQAVADAALRLIR